MAIKFYKGDLPAGLSFGNAVAVDTESMGLNWKRDRLCLIQLSAGDGDAHLVQLPKGKVEAPNLVKLFADSNVTKIFHFARADIVPIEHYLGVRVQPVYCTKIASILVRTFTDRHSLKFLARDLANIELAKEQQTSDWGADNLTPDQLHYAASDVLYLHQIKGKLDEMLAREGLTEIAVKTMAFLPMRAELDLRGYGGVDVFAYDPYVAASMGRAST